MTYQEARAAAQQKANEAARSDPEYARRGGCDWGVWKNAIDGFTLMRLPLPRNRSGTELRCEVVMPDCREGQPRKVET